MLPNVFISIALSYVPGNIMVQYFMRHNFMVKFTCSCYFIIVREKGEAQKTNDSNKLLGASYPENCCLVQTVVLYNHVPCCFFYFK